MQFLQKINVSYSINSGQVFLWDKNEDHTWYGINGNDVLVINENPFRIRSLLSNSKDFFREGDDIEKILNSIRKDSLVKQAVNRFEGLRLVRQDPFQCYISFIASSNSSIQNIRLTLQKLCKKFGRPVSFEGKEFFLFPEPKKLASSSLEDLKSCGLGYRAKAVKAASIVVSSGEIDFNFLKKSDYKTAQSTLKKVYGIGNKVADCIMLFSLEKLEAFPLDRWMLTILEKYYSKKFNGVYHSLTEKNYNALHEKIVNHFGPYAGYSQQFLFKMERDFHNKNWL